MKRLSVVISSMPGEENLSNNIQSKYVKVVDERKRVEILFGAPHPDVSALGRALGLEGPSRLPRSIHSLDLTTRPNPCDPSC